MKRNEICIRDPFVLTWEGKYYLYGTRSATCWGPAEGFDCYVSADLENWEGPLEIFRRPEGFFADRHYWAPECVERDGSFFLFATLGCADRKDGVYLLKSGAPTGPFTFCSRLTPEDWSCIDGTYWSEDGRDWLLFSHAFEDDPRGGMCAVALTPDLARPAGEPVTLFSAADAPWVRPVPFAKAEFGMDGDVFLSDGPCVFPLPDGHLGMSWSSWGERGYAVGLAVSAGGVTGPWAHLETPLFPENGGHGMLFTDLVGQARFALHYPNDKERERPVFPRVEFSDGVPHIAEALARQEEPA